MPRVEVTHDGGDRFLIRTRGHVVAVDQPVADGGNDSAPTPTELLVGSLASCVAFYTRRFLLRHGLAEAGLSVSADALTSSHPARVSSFDVAITLPESFPEERREALLRVASACTVHNTLKADPDIHVHLDAHLERL